MDLQQPATLLGGLTPAQFMRRHWQKRPLLVRGAMPAFAPPVDRARLFALAASEDVESRLLERHGQSDHAQWRLRHGPFGRKALPRLAAPDWTLLVQGVDLHDDGVHALMQPFRFIPDARVDDVMISYATDGGGVGPHFDSYDVFLLQAAGRRRWRIGQQKDQTLLPGLPVKILADFRPEQEVVLDPGDMLYLPPGWAHDGVALGECLSYSVGFRQPRADELARELLARLADEVEEGEGAGQLYTDPRQSATAAPAEIPAAMRAFARRALARALAGGHALDMCLGEWLSEPKPNVWFAPGSPGKPAGEVVLDRRSRMLYDAGHVYLNGEAFRASGRDARLMRKLADTRRLPVADRARLSDDAADVLRQWLQAGWLHGT